MSASLGAQMVKHLHAMQKAQLRSLGREDPWRRQWQPIPVCLPGKSYGQRSVTYSTDCRVTVTGKARGTWVLKCLKSGECCNYQENSRFCPTITDSSMSPHFSHSKGVFGVWYLWFFITPKFPVIQKISCPFLLTLFALPSTVLSAWVTLLSLCPVYSAPITENPNKLMACIIHLLKSMIYSVIFTKLQWLLVFDITLLCKCSKILLVFWYYDQLLSVLNLVWLYFWLDSRHGNPRSFLPFYWVFTQF